ncbi:MAG: hypothetical protein FWH18_01045 [Marinilabiliaceae bacterium]|nr:hypothetical protein [Marinilabiliaceae bacterium]
MIDIMRNISDAFGINSMGSLPAPVGIEIIGEDNDIFYLGPELDKRLMRGDRQNFINDLKVALKEAKDEQARKTN